MNSTEREKLRTLWAPLAPQSPGATLLRWTGYLTEGTGLMIRTQVMVALVNTALTIPILLLLKLPAVPTLTVLVFAGSLIPVIGNVAIGVVLALVAASVDGLSGAVTITILVAVLHKVESYYINPYFASSRLRLPSFLIILSLLISERLMGLPGLFLSLPVLVVWQRMRTEFLDSSPLDVAPLAPAAVSEFAVSVDASASGAVMSSTVRASHGAAAA